MSTLKSSLSRFLFFKEGQKYIPFLILLLVTSSGLGAILPGLMNKLTSSYEEKELFLETLKILGLVFTGTYLNRSIYNVVVNKYVVALIQYVRTDCYEKWLLSYELQTSSENKNDRYPQGEVLARIMNDTDSVRELVTSGTFGIVIDIFFVGSSLISFIALNKTAGIFLAIVQLFACFLLIWGSKYMRDVFLKVRNARSKLYRVVADVIGGVRETYYVDSNKFASKRSYKVFDEYLTEILKSNIWDASYYSLAESLFPIFLVFAVFIIPIAGMTQIGLIFAFIDVIQRSIGPIKDLSSKVANIQRALTGIIRINEFVGDLENERSTNIYKKPFDLDISRIRVDIVKFNYPRMSESDTPFVLENIEFSGERGDLVGIVGLSGSGKSTLLNILCANIIPDVGEIEILSKSGNDFHFNFNDKDRFSDYRELVGIVSQESHIFSESIRFNITMGRRDLNSFDDFWSWVCDKISYLKRWGITPDSIIDQEILSLGQKQLIAAIRACYLKKPIVLFDEISSSLDSKLEYALRQMILLAQENAITFVVAHRIETIIDAQTILVMKDGKLADKGDHNSLLSSSSIYGQFIKELSHS